MKKILLLLLALAVPAASLAATDRTQALKQLAAMEDEFCAATRAMGILAAFKHYATPDAVMLSVDPRKFRGADAIDRAIGPDRPGVTVTWKAERSELSEDGSLGYNYGRYEWRFPGPDGQPAVSSGWFLTIWKRQPDGTWRFVLDTGVPDPKQG